MSTETAETPVPVAALFDASHMQRVNVAVLASQSPKALVDWIVSVEERFDKLARIVSTETAETPADGVIVEFNLATDF